MTSERQTRRWAALLGAALAIGLAGPTAAWGQTPEEQARSLFREGNELYSRKMYLDALDRYRRARALFPSHKIDLNIGGTLDALGRRTEAAAYFERFLTQSADAPPEIIDAARARLGELRRKLCSVKVTCLVDGATVIVDGKGVGATPLELPVYLEPGTHTIELHKAGFVRPRRTLKLAAGEHRTLDLLLEPPGPRPGAGPSAAAPAPDPERAATRRRKTIWGLGALGVGAACALTAVVLYGVGGAQGSEAHERYREATDPAEIASSWEDVETARTKLVAGSVLMGVAAVATGFAIYELVTRPAPEERPSRLSLGLGLGSASGTLSLSGRY